MSTKPKYFLEEFAEDLLTKLGLPNLTETERQHFLPQIITNLELRLGDVLLPQVPDSAAPEFRSLSANDSTPEQWLAFWQKTVPNFQELVAQVLKDFAQESQNIFAS